MTMGFFSSLFKTATKTASKAKVIRSAGARAARQGDRGFTTKAFAAAGRAARSKK